MNYHALPRSNAAELSSFLGNSSKESQDINTMTLMPLVSTATVVAATFDKGVMIMADTIATYGSSKRFRNIHRFADIGTHTIVACDGDLSDAQELSNAMRQRFISDWSKQDNFKLTTPQYASMVQQIQYKNRSNINPLWQSVVIVGYDDEIPYVGMSDMYGSTIKENFVATGLGAYFALTILRDEHHAAVTESEAYELLVKCARVIVASDTLSSNTYEFATIKSDGISKSGPVGIDLFWNYEAWKPVPPKYGLVGAPVNVESTL